MEVENKLKEIFNTLKEKVTSKETISKISLYSFLISLLPVPGLQQTAQIVDRISNNKVLDKQFDDIWEKIIDNNSKVSNIENELEKVKEIAGTVKFNDELKSKIKSLIDEVIKDINSDEKTEWILETRNWSYQEMLNSLVEADFAQIIADNKSTNVIEKSEIKSKKTHLFADNNSKNFIDKTTFKGDVGSVGMNGISTKGNIIVSDSSIGFGEGGTLIFGGNPNLIKGNCPVCKTLIQIDKRDLVGYNKIQCPNCKNSFPFSIA